VSKTKEYPTIKGLTWHRTQYYSFFTPMDWHRFTWSDDRQGDIYGPDPDDPFTVFAVDVRDLGTKVTRKDLNVLAEAFFGAIKRLPECDLESHDRKATGKLLQLEAHYTFRDQGNTRKCWVRVFYHVTRQVTMTAQGATPEKYNYWMPMFFQAMRTANVHSTKPRLDSVANLA
jgi:hypothetical protein